MTRAVPTDRVVPEAITRRRSPARASRPAAGFGSEPWVSRLFKALTGLHYDVLLEPPAGLEWDVRSLMARCRRHARRLYPRPVALCLRCARKHVACALAMADVGHHFRGACGQRVFLLPLAGPAGPIGLIEVHFPSGAAAALRPGAADPRRRRREEDRFARRDQRAMLLLRLMASRTKLELEAQHAAAALNLQRQALRERDLEIARLRQALQGMIPGTPGARPGPRRESRARQLVRHMMERVRQQFATPLTLSGLAAELGLNASYASQVFAREAGIPFKSYLTALRIDRARELLSNPSHRVSEVAARVGYAQAGRFRAVFRSWTGMSPSVWREILRSD